MIPTKLITDEDVKKNGQLKEVGGPFTQLVAANGVFVRKSGKLFDAVIGIEKPVGIPELKEGCTFKTSKLPLREFLRVENFFKEVWKEHKSEAAVLLYASPEKKSWKILIPYQKVSSGSVKYDLKDVEKDYDLGGIRWYLFGSIHSHGSMAAFFSGTDDHDDLNFDGLHITIGKVDEEQSDYRARYMIHGREFKYDITEVVSYPELPDAPCEQDWLKRVERETPQIHVVGAQKWQGRSLFGTGPNYSNDDDWSEGLRRRAATAGNAGVAGVKTSHPAREVPPGVADKPADGRKNKKGKNGWTRYAAGNFCYMCTEYQGNCECSKRTGRTTSSSTCDLFNRTLPEKKAPLSAGVGKEKVSV